MNGRAERTWRSPVVAALVVIAALGISAGTAHAAPSAQPSAATDIGYEAHADGGSVVTSIDSGAFRITDTGDAVEVLDDHGKVVAALPLTIRWGENVYPIDVDLVDRTLTLTPQVPAEVVTALRSVATSPESVADEGFETQKERDDAALARFSSYLRYATMIGGLVAGVVLGVFGLAVGCGLLALTVVGTPVGCLGGLVAGFGAGSVLGTIFVGGPALVILGIQYLITVNTPFVAAAPAP
ncbi:MAG: hypothetical protein WAW17_17480 [Rhodococcus sp. (in: high G+C Gram-positive bacteria)]|uniref:hypothetical protein n=1 Tax=Rhodococcus sp. TaxID=1831 RepID=UPI003BAE64C9